MNETEIQDSRPAPWRARLAAFASGLSGIKEEKYLPGYGSLRSSPPAPTPVYPRVTGAFPQERLLAALEAGGIGTWIWDIPSGRIWCDPLARILFAQTADQPADFSQASFLTCVHPADRARLENAFQEAATGLDREVEFRVLHPDGDTRWVSAKGRVERDLQGQACRLIGVCWDITARKRTEQELVIRNEQLASYGRISEVMQADELDAPAFDTIAGEISKMTGFPIVAIEMCNPDRAVMIFRGIHGLSLEGLPQPFELPMDVTPSGQVVQTGQTLWELDLPNRREFTTPFFRQLAATTYLCVPIKVGGQVIGTLSLVHRERITVEPRTVAHAESLANYLATLFGRLQERASARKGEAELAAVYDRAPSVMCLLDERLRIVRANRAAAEFAGASEEQLQGLSPGRFISCPETAKGVLCGSGVVCANCDLCRSVLETLATGKSWQRARITKSALRQGQTQEFTLLISTSRIQVAGMTRVLLSLENVTESERADEQIRSQAALLDIARDAIIVRDFSDRILHWNAGAHRMYGWSAAEAQGQTLSSLLPVADEAEEAKALQTVREKEDWTGERIHRTRAGAEITVQSRWTLVRDRQGNPKSILIVNSDITARKQLEAQLLRAQRLESIGTLASGLAHDLNNVLTPIMMAVNFLKDDAKDESTRTWLQTLETCSQRGADIIRQVLMFARGVEGSRVPLDLKHLVVEMERIVRETFPRSISLRRFFAQPTPLVKADATQMQQVLMNLCVNARDAMPRGGTLTLRLDCADLNGDATRLHPKALPGSYAVLSVADTGEGIPPDIMDKIFDPFFTTKPLGRGTGLGLPTVLGIAEGHGGFVVVESKIGHGTTFRVYLPAETEGRLAAASPAGPTTLPKGNGELILVVDDESSVRRLTEAILSRHGYRVLGASDGREALSIFTDHSGKIKAMITDLMMPRMDGPATIRAIHAIQPGLKTITITGLGEDGRHAEAIAAGSDLILNKPFTSEQLLTNLKNLLEG